MLTEAQEKYLKTIPEDKVVVIKPWDPKTKEAAGRLIGRIKSVAPELTVLYMGASALELPGVDDLDFTAVCSNKDFQKYLPDLEKILGKPKSVRQQHVRWDDINWEGYHADVYLTDPNSEGLEEQIRLFELLKNSPTLLTEYKDLKEKSNGLPYREYQRRKYEFYNRVLGIGNGSTAV